MIILDFGFDVKIWFYLQSNPLIRNKPANALPRTSIITGFVNCGIGFGFPRVKSVSSRVVSKGDTMALSSSSRQAFVSADNVIVGKTWRWFAK